MNSNYLNSLKGKSEISVEMVCLGNICRSPMAAAVLQRESVNFKNPTIRVFSSGTSKYHIGEGAHRLSMKTWELAGYRYEHVASRFNPRSFQEMDLILAMDLSNRAMILTAAKSDSDRSKVMMLRQFDPALNGIDPVSRAGGELEVPDPWGEEIDSYQEVLGMIERAVAGLLDKFR